MAFLQLLRRILSAPVTLVFPTVHEEYGEEYSLCILLGFMGFGWDFGGGWILSILELVKQQI